MEIIIYNQHKEEKILDVDYNFSPPEKAVMYYPDGDGYPGCPAEVEINSVMLGARDIQAWLSESRIEEIEQKIVEYESEYNSI